MINANFFLTLGSHELVYLMDHKTVTKVLKKINYF